MRLVRDFRLPPGNYVPLTDARPFEGTATQREGADVAPGTKQQFAIKCGTCRIIMTHRYVSTIPLDVVAKRFRADGWYVASKPSRDLCPNCRKRPPRNTGLHPNLATEPSEMTKPSPKAGIAAREFASVASAASSVPVAAEKPRTMSRDERRIIFEKLNDCYVSENVGYASGWSDKKVAADLGVPAAWVAQVRDELFGPLVEDQRVAEARKSLDTLGSLLDEATSDLRKLTSTVETLRKLHDETRATVKAIEREIA